MSMKWTIKSPKGKKLLVLKAKKKKPYKKPPPPMGFRPICEHGVEIDG